MQTTAIPWRITTLRPGFSDKNISAGGQGSGESDGLSFTNCIGRFIGDEGDLIEARKEQTAETVGLKSA